MARSISIHVIFTLSHEDLDSYFGAIPFRNEKFCKYKTGCHGGKTCLLPTPSINKRIRGRLPGIYRLLDLAATLHHFLPLLLGVGITPKASALLRLPSVSILDST
jgi:hypothetical protein